MINLAHPGDRNNEVAVDLHVPCERELTRRATLLLREGFESCRAETLSNSLKAITGRVCVAYLQQA